MKTPTITKEETGLDLAGETTQFCLRTGSVICALIGVWAFTCLAAAIVKFGPLEVIRGYFTAVTGF